MKKICIVASMLLTGALISLSSCAPTKAIAEKSGAQLWGENCNRCHSAPSADQYSKEQWTTIGEHMKLKAGITNDETTKIVAFLRGE